MDGVKMIRERRSVRKFKDEKVGRDLVGAVIADATYAPSWANFQEVRYTVVDDEQTVAALAERGFGSFVGNRKIVGKAPGAIVVSIVRGKGGYSPKGEKVSTKSDDAWGMFDAGVASQTICLSAWEKGIGTVIMGIFDEAVIAELVGLPADETVAAVIAYGYPANEPGMPGRKPVSEIARFI